MEAAICGDRLCVKLIGLEKPSSEEVLNPGTVRWSDQFDFGSEVEGLALGLLREKKEVAPFPTSLSAQTSPPCLLTILSTAASPIPFPGNSSAEWSR
jgi:hypothetical protein